MLNKNIPKKKAMRYNTRGRLPMGSPPSSNILNIILEYSL